MLEYLLSGKQMKDVDSYTIESIGVPSAVLMERAALAVVQKIERDGKNRKNLVVCGIGNNGADGLAVCRNLIINGCMCDYYVVGNKEKGTKEFQMQLNILHNLNITETYAPDFLEYDNIVDGIFGVGLSRDVEGGYKELIEQINAADAYKYAIDIPSGINSDDGQVMGCAIKADCTVTFGYQKIGSVLYPGRAYSGDVVIAQIGYPDFLPEKFQCKDIAVTDEILKCIPKRDAYSNKGTFGKILIVAGSKEYSGAAVLSARAALKTGAGLVKVITHKENKMILYHGVPEVISGFYEDGDTECSEWIEELRKSIFWADSIVIGPGISENQDAKNLLKEVLDSCGEKSVVVDASALNIISTDERLKEQLRFNVVLTPHLGETSRLINKPIAEIKRNLKGTAQNICETMGAGVVLKDSVTISTSGEQIYYNMSGNNGMATGGSGDVLSGILGTVLTWNMPEKLKLPLAVFVHGKAGDKAAEELGTHSMTAMDIIDRLSFLRQYE